MAGLYQEPLGWACVRRLAVQLLLATAAVGSCAPAASALDVQAHRGGGLSHGKPVALENSLSAFKTAEKRGADVVELDVHVTSDGVPFVMHDGTLDRTTDCKGGVAEMTAAEVSKCHIDVLGTNDVFKRAPGSTEPVPRLAAVLKWAKGAKARLNIEVNHYPGEPGYDPSDKFVNAELDTIDASGIPKSRLLIQSFLPGNLTPAKERGYTTAIITFTGGNPQALDLAKDGGFDVLEPQWPVDPGFVARAHAAGRKVVPYTLDKRSDVFAARRAGVDGIITDDPAATRASLRCYPVDQRYRTAKRKLAAAKAAYKKAKGKKAKKRALAKVHAASKALAKARAARRKACG